MNLTADTIAAIATPPGVGAIAVIRLSGPGAIAIADAVFSKKISTCQTHTAHYGKILNSERKAIDHVLLLVMKTPRSYTGEDTVEISCHGGSLIAQKILSRLYEAGARPARPGEFSLRAFLNGKIDLAQAEAVQTLIAAKNDQAMQQANATDAIKNDANVKQIMDIFGATLDEGSIKAIDTV